MKIPNSVTEIGDYAFCWCEALTSVTIAGYLTEIGTWAFYWCSNLTSVYCNVYRPISTLKKKTIFSDYQYRNTRLYCPKGAREAYISTEPWKYFYNILVFTPTGVENVNATDENADKVYYDMNGHRLNTPIKGMNIIDGKKVMMK
ncbi:MAG: leucine-rich repeat domain-containing protein [Prevotella sp.]|nr:leucine-rich repeat domain-containing protein [Prevotella sp.]